MKTMTCKQLGGACDVKFQAETFEEMAQLSKNHGMQMFQEGEQEHIKIMNEMRSKMGDPNAMKDYMDEKRKVFDSLPEDN
jgi:hypothetical protein